MLVDRIIKTAVSVLASVFGIIWIGIMVSAAASIPVIGFAVSIAATLVAYAVHAAATGKSQRRIERLSA